MILVSGARSASRSSAICSRDTGRSTRCWSGAIESSAVSQVIEVACGSLAARLAVREPVRRPDSPTSRPTCPGWRRASGRRWSGWGRFSDTPPRASSSTRCARTVRPAWPRWPTRWTPNAALAIITEGLLGYLDRTSVIGIWARFAAVLQASPTVAISPTCTSAIEQTLDVRAFRTCSRRSSAAACTCTSMTPRRPRSAARGRARSAFGATRSCRTTPGGELVHIIEASTVRSQSTLYSDPRARGPTPRARRCG